MLWVIAAVPVVLVFLLMGAVEDGAVAVAHWIGDWMIGFIEG